MYKGTKVCALGLLDETLGYPLKRGYLANDFALGKLAGLRGTQVSEVARRNDGTYGSHRHTFSEIADVVEGWFRQ